MTMTDTARPRPAAATAPAEIAWTVLCLGLAAVVAGAILLSPYPPLQDFSEWAYQGQLLARWFRGEPVGALHLATSPIPNSSVQLLLGLLSVVLPPALAARLFLLGLVAAATAVALALGRRYQPQAAGAFAALLLVAVFFHAGFWNGYANYQLGLVILGAWLLLPEGRRVQARAILPFSLALFFTHAMVFAAFGLLVGLTALLRRRIAGAVLGLLPAAGLTLWYVLAGAGANATEPGSTGGLLGFIAYKLYTFAKLGPYHNFVFLEGGDAALRPWLYRAGIAANLVFAAGLGVLLALGLRGAFRAGRRPWPVLATAALLLAGFAVLPDLVQNVVNPGERLLLPALLLLLVALPLPPALVRSLGLGAVLLLANVVLLAEGHRGWQAPVHYTDLEGRKTELFRHRPTAFACKWQEMQHAAATGEAPRQPISFATSLLVGQTYQGCTGQPG
ncbi:hypothetical protein [Paracraurococcus lichenis]|uniref:Glycosyltransferase RgtA/B/C/D-like domain-containing protein n=1 Tax=Paracraurococcus lichenis TaxID=3064888 RepID=A0ABT9E6P4_9PROT|nr:hypothetical protein [Paracraurococcus sp. LOR1-02]MDO9711828.1 hypothetical protein [Paracraurococcus sp. LOR1-02]